MHVCIMEQKLPFLEQNHVLSQKQNTKLHRKLFFLQVKLMMVGDVMLSKTASGRSEIRKIGAAKQPQRPSSPVLPYLSLFTYLTWPI